MDDVLDIILFGASGYTGKYTIAEIDKLTKINGRMLTWGVAGRSEQKLKQTLLEMGKKMGKDLSSIPIIVSDVNDSNSLKQMTARARVIVNTCGPYRLYGEPVIKACLDTGTHHVDITGEPQFMERMQLEYHQAAKDKGIYIISACGFESIPIDLGIVYLEQKFKGTLNSVESYLEMDLKVDSSAASLNIGTYESAIYVLAFKNELAEIRSKVNKKSIPTFKPKLKKRALLHISNLTNVLSVPFLTCDRSVVTRSQRYFYEMEKKRPIQVMTYMSLPQGTFSFANIILGFLLCLFMVLVNFEWGRKILLNHPRFFTYGKCSREGPSEEVNKNTVFSFKLYGQGWPEQLEDVNDEFTSPPNKTMTVKVSGTDPAYGATCTALTLAAIVILEEHGKMPDRGGVITPAVAFSKTTMIEQLHEHGIKFEII